MTQRVQALIEELRSLGYHVDVTKIELLPMLLGKLEEARGRCAPYVPVVPKDEHEEWDLKNRVFPELAHRGYIIDYSQVRDGDWYPEFRIRIKYEHDEE